MLHKSLSVFYMAHNFWLNNVMQSPEGVVRQNAATKSQAGHMSGTKVALCVRSQALGWGKNTSAASTYSCFNILGKACGLKLYLSLASIVSMTMLIAMKISWNPLTRKYFKVFFGKNGSYKMTRIIWLDITEKENFFCIQVNFNFRERMHKARLIEPCVQLKEQLDLCSICDFQSLGLIE